jgi:thymidylate synthase
MQLFHGTTADDVWLDAARFIDAQGGAHVQRSRAGDTVEIMGAIFEIEDPTKRWTVSRVPALNPAFALAEVVWILNGRHDSKFINYWNPKLPNFAGNTPEYHGAYGYRLRVEHGMDQLTRAYNALLKNPDSRQVVLQIWDPQLDFPMENGAPASPDIPCNICSFLKIRDNKLEWTQVMRSNDLILGTPHNFIQFTTLQEVIAAWLGVDVGTYRHYSDCLHVYTRDWKSLRSLKQIEVPSTPARLRFTKEESDKLFSELASRMEEMISDNLTKKQLGDLVFTTGLNATLQDWLFLISADCARRKGWKDLAEELGNSCNDRVLNQLWIKWNERMTRTRHHKETESIKNKIQMFLPFWA